MTDSAHLLAEIRRTAPDVGASGIDLSLDRMHALLATLGDPHLKLARVVHVAGTNGKGSTLAFLRAFLEASGQRVHCFTSPYLVRPHESVVLAGKEIDETAFCDVLERVRAAMETAPATPFEAFTAAALLAFSEAPADFVLLETGLGGRLDATNVVADPVLTLLTPISVDHAEYLGDGLLDIAREKAGILKAGVPIVIGRQNDDVYALIERYAHDLGGSLQAAGRDFDVYEQHSRLVFQDEHHLRDLGLPTLTGHHQRDNAGLAIAAVLELANRFDDLSVNDEGLEAGLAAASWPGRLQRLQDTPLHDRLPQRSEIWLDGGHNPAAATVLAHAMSDMEDTTPMPIWLIVGMLSSKDADAFLAPFRGLARMVLAITLEPGENATAEALQDDVIAGAAEANGMAAKAVPSVDAALALIGRTNIAPVRVLICGSLQLAGQVLADAGQSVSG